MTPAERYRVAGEFDTCGWLVEGGPGLRVTMADEGAELSMLCDPPHVWRAEGDPQTICHWIAVAGQIIRKHTS